MIYKYRQLFSRIKSYAVSRKIITQRCWARTSIIHKFCREQVLIHQSLATKQAYFINIRSQFCKEHNNVIPPRQQMPLRRLQTNFKQRENCHNSGKWIAHRMLAWPSKVKIERGSEKHTPKETKKRKYKHLFSENLKKFANLRWGVLTILTRYQIMSLFICPFKIQSILANLIVRTYN